LVKNKKVVSKALNIASKKQPTAAKKMIKNKPTTAAIKQKRSTAKMNKKLPGKK
jgi:hypothetical protein